MKKFVLIAGIATISFVFFVLAASWAVYNGSRERRDICESQNELRIVLIAVLADAREQFADPDDPIEQGFYRRAFTILEPEKC